MAPVERLSDRALTVADAALPTAERLLPIADRLASSIADVEVEAVVRVMDRLPQLSEHLERDVLPLLDTLGQVGPDVHDILDAVQDLTHAIKGMPGMNPVSYTHLDVYKRQRRMLRTWTSTTRSSP